MADSFTDWLAEHPPPDAIYTQSLARIAQRDRAGEEFFLAVRELLDEFALTQTDAQRLRAISDEPERCTEHRHDAYLAALGEHLALIRGLRVPPWTGAPHRFLQTFWFVSDVKGFRAMAVAESPAAFRRRGIFISERSLIRV